MVAAKPTMVAKPMHAATAANDNRPQQRPAEFDARVMAYVPGLRNLARRYRRTDEQRNDLVTDTIMSALDRWQSYRADGGMWNWLAWTMRGIVSNHAQQAAVRRKHIKFVAMDDVPHAPIETNQEDYADLSSALAALGRVKNGDVVMRRAMGDSLREIAEDRGVTAERVRQIEVAARAELRRAV